MFKNDSKNESVVLHVCVTKLDCYDRSLVVFIIRESLCRVFSDSHTQQFFSPFYSRRIYVSFATGDVLIFMPGQEDIEVTCDLISGVLNLS